MEKKTESKTTMKQILVKEIVKGENTYRFELPVGVPFGEAYDAAFEALVEMSKLTANAVEKVKEAKKEFEDKKASDKESISKEDK